MGALADNPEGCTPEVRGDRNGDLVLGKTKVQSPFLTWNIMRSQSGSGPKLESEEEILERSSAQLIRWGALT